MKRKRNQRLLTATVAVAGLAMGAGIAMAAHAPIQLYTYEEIAMQYGMAKMPVMVDPVSKKGFPYSPKQSCGNGNGVTGCHDYDNISDHAFHSAQGRNEFLDVLKDGNGVPGAYGQFVDKQKPWNSSGAMVGKWCPPSLYETPNLMDQDQATAGVQDKLYATGAEFRKSVDLSMWDFATVCGSCHVGGGFTEKDRNGVRHSMRQADPTGKFDAYLYYVDPKYNPSTGAAITTDADIKRAPWIYPMTTDNGPLLPDKSNAMMAPNGWGQEVPGMMTAGQLMMPNVREMDCLICHYGNGGFNNLMNSVMVYSGMLSMAPMASTGLMDMNQMSPTYQGYNTAKVAIDPATGIVSLNAEFLANINKQPETANCRQCHIPTNLVDLPSMMKDFLSAAPMIYTGNGLKTPFTGLEMPSFDFNAPFGNYWNFTLPPGPGAGTPANPFGFAYWTSPVLNMTNVASNMIASIGFPSAMGPTVYNMGIAQTSPMGLPGTLLGSGDIGGGNPSGTGPLYFEAFVGNNQANGFDQNVLKKSYVPFPRSEWFKRGDLWEPGTEVHLYLGCKGCHMDTKTTKVDTATFDGKSQCDPGRGHDWISGTESGLVATTNSRNTVKRCENCHVTGKNNDGVEIDTFGAPLATTAHQKAGLLANIAQAVKLDGTGAEVSFIGSHLDVIECETCHVKKETMTVRLLDSTSGNRYPNMLGFDLTKGMLGMFTNPTPMMQNQLQEWKLLFGWSRLGNADKMINGTVNADWRRKIFPINMITAALWNNTDPTVDANGDGFTGAPGGVKTYTSGETTIYDPWLMRELRDGINYGPSGFSPIPVGFGNGAYQSAYAADGSFTGAWKYVGVYGGNIIFTTPDELSAYKTMRGADWTNTELLFSGVPFMVTHNIRNTASFALGKATIDDRGDVTAYGCADCHAAGKNFFDGGFNMTGTAIKTTVGGQFMMSPAEPVTVMAKKGDIRTIADIFDKSGKQFEVKFDESVNADGTPYLGTGQEYLRTTDLNRSEGLYPKNISYTAVDGSIKASRAAWVSYLTSTTGNPAAFGIGVAPTAAINPIADIDASLPGVQVATTSLTLSAQDGQPGGFSTYKWYFTDGSKDVNGNIIKTVIGNTQSVSYTFTPGAKTINLEVTDEEGKLALDSQTITVVAPGIGIAADAAPVTATTIESFTFSNLPGPTNTKVKVMWGDGAIENITVSNVTTLTRSHRYATAGTKAMTVYVYNGTKVIGSKTQNITVVP